MGLVQETQLEDTTSSIFNLRSNSTFEHTTLIYYNTAVRGMTGIYA